MLRAASWILWALPFVGCGSDPSFRDCTVSCANNGACPDGLSCGAEGLCRTGGTSAGCSPTDASAGSEPVVGDAPVDGRTSVTLRQTADGVPSSNGTVACTTSGTSPNEITGDGAWYRVFALEDSHFGITTPFHVSSVSFGVLKSRLATNVTVGIGRYSGTVPTAATIDPVTFTWTADVSVPATNTDHPSVVNVPLTADLAAGSVIVVGIKVQSEAGDSFFPAGSASAEWAPAYFHSSVQACSGPGVRPAMTDSPVIIEVNGDE